MQRENHWQVHSNSDQQSRDHGEQSVSMQDDIFTVGFFSQKFDNDFVSYPAITCQLYAVMSIKYELLHCFFFLYKSHISSDVIQTCQTHKHHQYWIQWKHVISYCL